VQVYLTAEKSLKIRFWHSPAIAFHHQGAHLQRLCFASLRTRMKRVKLPVIKDNQKSSVTSGKVVETMSDPQNWKDYVKTRVSLLLSLELTEIWCSL